MEDEQAGVDDSQEDRVAELSGDIYRLEMLIGCLTDEYKRRISEISGKHKKGMEYPSAINYSENCRRSVVLHAAELQ
jgi:hypothetical protein